MGSFSQEQEVRSLELRMADRVTAALNAQMRALLAEREAMDEWAWRLDAAKREMVLCFDAETRALHLEMEALGARARHLVMRVDTHRDIVDSMVRQALLLLRPHVNDDNQALHLGDSGVMKQKDKNRKASYLEPASGMENRSMILVSQEDQPSVKNENLRQGDKKTPVSNLCKLDCQQANMASHLSCERHKRMKKTPSEEPPLSDWKNHPATSGIRNPLKEEKKKASLMKVSEPWCALCQVNCLSSKGFRAHQVGRKHLRRVFIESKKEAKRVGTAQERKRVNPDGCPFGEGSWVWTPDIATIGLSECKNECIDNGSEKSTCVLSDLESLDGSVQPTTEVLKRHSCKSFTPSPALCISKARALCISKEAEYRAACIATCEAVWLRRLLAELGYPQKTTILYFDNQSCIAIACNPAFHTYRAKGYSKAQEEKFE